MSNLKNMIKDHLAGLPEGQISPGIFATVTGENEIEVMSIHGTTTIEKMTCNEFLDAFDPYRVVFLGE